MKYGDYWMSAWDWDHWHDNGTYNSEDLYPPYCYNTEPGVKQVYEMFTNPEDLYYHTQRTRYYISRYGYSTNIYEFELLSEPYHINEFWILGSEAAKPINDPNNPERQLLRDAMLSYNSTISSYIKSNCNQLVGINYSGPEWIPGAELENDTVSKLTTIDIIGMNMYGNEPNKLLIAKSTQNNITSLDENSYYARVKAFLNKYGKPVLFPEFGIEEDKHRCSGFTGHYVDVMTAGFTGIAGFNMWDGFMHPTPKEPFDEENLWPSTIRAQQHMNANDVINTLKNGNGKWVQGRELNFLWHNFGDEETQSKEHQYYLSKNKELGVGYVKNRSYNIHTMRTNDTCWLSFNTLNLPIDELFSFDWNNSSPSRYLKIDGLKNNTDYQVDFYSFDSPVYGYGGYVSSYCSGSNLNGKLTLEFPHLDPWNYNSGPILWYVVHQQNCQDGITFSPENTQQSLDIKLNEDETINNEIIDGNISSFLFPNPTYERITIASKQTQEIQIHSNKGIILYKQLITKGENILNIGFLPPGFYFVYFQLDNITVKLIIL